MSDLNESFIHKAIQKHGTKFDYSKVNYVTAKTKVSIICKIHGEFLQTPNNHLSGCGCPKCVGRYTNRQDQILNWIQKAELLHEKKYDYSRIDWTNIRKKIHKVEIVCQTHGSFYQLWGNHISEVNRNGCPKCAVESCKNKKRLPFDKFVEKSKKVHGDRYVYQDTDYHGAHYKVTIICTTHGEFKCTPANHWSNGVGCPRCLHNNPSRGEAKISAWLESNNIPFEFQKSFPDLWHKAKNGRLKYDFYLPERNTLIEYDGEHHTQPITWSKKIDGEKRLADQIQKDKLKEAYALKHGIRLLRINYDESIQDVLRQNLL